MLGTCYACSHSAPHLLLQYSPPWRWRVSTESCLTDEWLHTEWSANCKFILSDNPRLLAYRVRPLAANPHTLKWLVLTRLGGIFIRTSERLNIQLAYNVMWENWNNFRRFFLMLLFLIKPTRSLVSSSCFSSNIALQVNVFFKSGPRSSCCECSWHFLDSCSADPKVHAAI